MLNVSLFWILSLFCVWVHHKKSFFSIYSGHIQTCMDAHAYFVQISIMYFNLLNSYLLQLFSFSSFICYPNDHAVKRGKNRITTFVSLLSLLFLSFCCTARKDDSQICNCSWLRFFIRNISFISITILFRF
jgi:hypothetical protein